MKLKFIYVLYLIIGLLNGSIKQAKGELRYAAVLYRHGDRTPVESYPLDPWRNESMWPVKFGQLTNTGKMQHFKFGQFLRERYASLISPYFDPAEVYVRSTNVDRTLMSALANLAGLYPPINQSLWNPELAWQPIPVHTIPEKEDALLAMKKSCPAYNIELNRVTNDQRYLENLRKYQKLMDYLSMHTGLEVRDYYGIMSIYSTLKIEEEYKFKLPDWTRAVYPKEMVEPSGYSFEVNTLTPTLARLEIGPFMKELTRNMLKVMHTYNSKITRTTKYKDVDGVEPLKLNIYSAHDLNIGSVLNGLGLYDGKCPVYTSAILFELDYDEAAEVHLVKIFYRNTTDNQAPTRLNLPKCGLYCPLDKFVKEYKFLIPDDWNYECHKTTKNITWIINTLLGMIIFAFLYALHNILYSNLSTKYEQKYRRDTLEMMRMRNSIPLNNIVNAETGF